MKLGIISDIHEDLERLNEALHRLDQEGCDEVACLGDIVGFVIPSFAYFDTRDASACLQKVRANCKYIVAGNHDLYPAKRIPEYNAGFEYPENWYSLDHKLRKKMAGEKIWLNEEIEPDTLLSAEERKFMKSIPEFHVLNLGSLNIMLSHYLYPDLTGSTIAYYERFGPVEAHLNFMKAHNCLLGFSGHQHVEGFYNSTFDKTKHKPFGKYTLGQEIQWITGPCVANGKKHNGCLVFNTETFELEAIPLDTPPRIMEAVYLDKD